MRDERRMGREGGRVHSGESEGREREQVNEGVG